MDNIDLHVSHGPVSSLPGSSHHLPPGSVCDEHSDRPAVRRLQGETDSFGCEYFLVCQECLDKYRAEIEEERAKPKYCQWCQGLKTEVHPYRDMDEGMAGPVYQVCTECRVKDQERWAAETEEFGRYDSGFDDDHDDSGEDDPLDDPLDDDDDEPVAAEVPKEVKPPVVTFKRVRRIVKP